MLEHTRLKRQERLWRAAVPLGWPMAMVATTALMSLKGMPVCAFRHLSGQPCPLCGATHACAALLDGDPVAAWQANPGLMPLLAIAAVQTVALSVEALSARSIASHRLWTTAWSIGFSVFFAAWILRLHGLSGMP